MRKTVTLLLARAGIIAALYAVLSFAVFPVASGAIQFRVSEALTLLPLLYVEAIPALFVGCIAVNLLTGCGEGVSVYVLGIYPAVKLFALKEKGVRFLQ